MAETPETPPEGSPAAELERFEQASMNEGTEDDPESAHVREELQSADERQRARGRYESTKEIRRRLKELDETIGKEVDELREEVAARDAEAEELRRQQRNLGQTRNRLHQKSSAYEHQRRRLVGYLNEAEGRDRGEARPDVARGAL